MVAKKWRVRELDAGAEDGLARDLSCSRLLARLLHRRGVSDPDAARLFLDPKLSHLHDPFLLPGMEAAVARIEKAVRGREKVAIFGDPTRRGLAKFDAEERAASNEKLDVVIPVLHGTYGEDGTIQGLLEMADIPYVGCGVLGSAAGMDKVIMKRLFREAGLPIVEFTHFLRTQWEADPLLIETRVSEVIGFPCFVKPANLGSSVGISKATDLKSLNAAIAPATANRSCA